VRALVLCLVAGCAEAPMPIEDMPCPPDGTQLTYASFGQPFMAAYCDRCHTGASSGAPGDYRFDSHAGVLRYADRIFIRAAGPNVTMPPGPDDPPEDERNRLAEWLACGAP